MHNTLRARTTHPLLLLVLSLAFTLTACGSGDDPALDAGPGSAATKSSASSQNNDADVTFIRDMTPHHESALAMAELAVDRAENAQIKDLAKRIAAAQTPEIEQMAELARAFGVDVKMGGDKPHSGASGGAMEGGAARLEKLSGAAFDKAFLEEMIPHHESAVAMSQTELDAGKNPEAKALAQAIISGQTKEIAEMKALLAKL